MRYAIRLADETMCLPPETWLLALWKQRVDVPLAPLPVSRRHNHLPGRATHDRTGGAADRPPSRNRPDSLSLSGAGDSGRLGVGGGACRPQCPLLPHPVATVRWPMGNKRATKRNYTRAQ